MKLWSLDGILGAAAAVGSVFLTFYLSSLHDQIADSARVSGMLPSVAAMISERNDMCQMAAFELSLDSDKRGIVSFPSIDRTAWLVARSDPATMDYLGNDDASAIETAFQDIGKLNAETELSRLMFIEGMNRETVLDIGTIVSDATQRVGSACAQTRSAANDAESRLQSKIASLNSNLRDQRNDYQYRVSALAACIALLLLMAALGGIVND